MAAAADLAGWLNLQEAALGRPLRRREMIVVEMRRRDGAHELTIRTAVARPDVFRVTVERNGKALFSEGHDGERAWDSRKGGPVRVVDHPVAVASLRRKGLWLAGRRPLAELAKAGLAVELHPELEDATGRALPVLRLRFDPVVSKLSFLDPGTGRVVVERDEFADADEDEEYRPVEIHTTSTHEVDGMWFPSSQRVRDVETGDERAELTCASAQVERVRNDYLAPLRS